ncbi:MAG TPA: UDP binding domain-containing protein [Candidatus Bathyarchaeia archaeon]|nr:UDP binding domain-containing protein [Candidatus Bathyarchaeia archaeon]
MSSSILQLKPETLSTAEARRKFTVSVVGCEQTGILHAVLLADAGFKVFCVDANQTIIDHLTRGRAPFIKPETQVKLKSYVKTARINATTDIKTAVSQSDATFITTPVNIDEKQKPDYSNLEKICKQTGSNLRRGSLVIITSTVGVGVIENMVKELLENTSGLKVGADLGLAYSPVFNVSLKPLEKADCKRIVAATDKNSLEAASAIIEATVGKDVQRIESIKTAEAATLFETVQQNANVALADEFALFCEKTGIDYLEVSRLALSIVPSPTLTDRNSQRESNLLLEDAENSNVKLRIPKIAAEINEEMINHVTNLARDALRNCGKPLRRARISLFGISQTPNVKDTPKRTTEDLAKALEAKGARVSIFDPYFSNDELTEIPNRFKKNLNEALENVDCIIILTAHDQYKRLNLKKLKIVMKIPAAIIDLEGVLEPDKIEKEGFTYRGFGRGVWTK